MKSAFGVEHQTEISKISLSPFRTQGLEPGRIASIKHLRSARKENKRLGYMAQPPPAPAPVPTPAAPAAAVPPKKGMGKGTVGALAGGGGLVGGFGISQANRR